MAIPRFGPTLRLHRLKISELVTPPLPTPPKKIAFKVNRHGNHSLKGKFIDLCICMYVCFFIYFFLNKYIIIYF